MHQFKPFYPIIFLVFPVIWRGLGLPHDEAVEAICKGVDALCTFRELSERLWDLSTHQAAGRKQDSDPSEAKDDDLRRNT